MRFVWISEQTAIISLYSIYCFYNIDLNIYSPVVTIRTTSLTFTNSTICPHSAFICFVWISAANYSRTRITFFVFSVQAQYPLSKLQYGVSLFTDSPHILRFLFSTKRNLSTRYAMMLKDITLLNTPPFSLTDTKTEIK